MQTLRKVNAESPNDLRFQVSRFPKYLLELLAVGAFRTRRKVQDSKLTARIVPPGVQNSLGDFVDLRRVLLGH